MNPIDDWSDTFGRQLALGSTNHGDLPSYHTYTPSRHRLTRDTGSGLTRVNLHYEDIDALSYFDDNKAGEQDVYILTPDQGNRIQWKTAQRFEYVVGYDGLPTLALGINREPVGDDRITFGIDTTYPPLSFDDGYFAEHNSTHDPQEVDIFEKRNGNEIGTRKTVSIAKALTEFQRWELQYNWYNVGENRWTETHTTPNDGQINQQIGRTNVQEGDANSGPGGRGPLSGAGRIAVEVERDSASSNFEVWVGSMSFFTLGDDKSAFEEKWAKETGLSPSQSTDYEPLFVIRKDPNDPATKASLARVEATAGPGGEILAMAMDPSLVLNGSGNPIPDGDYTSPVQHGVSQFSAIEIATTVAQIPDATGTPATTVSEPGGYQIVGSSDARKSEEGSALRQEKEIVDGDVAVVLAKPDGTNSDFEIEYIVREGR